MTEKTHFGFKEVNADKKSEHVGEVFHSVAEEYDLMNDAMSFGMHRLWKKILIELSELSEGSVVLDIASGTADIPINENFFHNCSFALASGESLPYQDHTFDLVTVGFGLRNFTDKLKGLKEMRRVLKPNGVLLILEFSKPTNSFFSKVYDWYSFNIIPRLGSLLANNSESYQYLAESIRMHPDQETLRGMVLESGFTECKFYNLVNGVVAIHQAK